MMPIIRPLEIHEVAKSEYRKEQEAFANLQADFHLRRASKLRGQFLRKWVLRVFQRRSHQVQHRA